MLCFFVYQGRRSTQEEDAGCSQLDDPLSEVVSSFWHGTHNLTFRPKLLGHNHACPYWMPKRLFCISLN
uniref:Uncharacterized protein n=1 Tax=Rhizophora mucronata TaxID=61149 RepID=A0A2P2LEA0_RHIMU